MCSGVITRMVMVILFDVWNHRLKVGSNVRVLTIYTSKKNKVLPWDLIGSGSVYRITGLILDTHVSNVSTC